MDRKKMLSGAPYHLNDDQIRWVQATLSSMTEEQKIRQVFCTIAYSDDEAYLKDIAAGEFGGLMCRAMERDALLRLVATLQSNSKIPLLIAGNMEAGMNQCCLTGSYVGCQMAVAATDDVRYASELGRIIGEEASALGMNWAFAPVTDIDYNWRNPITNTRTYGSDPARVTAMSAAYIEALQRHGVAASAKHFPGDGVDERDQHLLSSVNDLPAEEWMRTYGSVYKACIDAGALTVMAGYIMQPALSKKHNPSLRDEDILPGALSKELISGVLRGKLGFRGTVVTDSSAMAGLGCAMARRDALPACIMAGCDMILFAKNMEEDLGFIRAALADGSLTRERLDEANMRVLALKAALRLPERAAAGQLLPDPTVAARIVGCRAHKAVAEEIASRSVTLVKEERGVLPLTPDRYQRILLYDKSGGDTGLAFGAASKAALFCELLRQEGFAVELYAPSQGFEGLEAPTSAVTGRYDLLIYLACMATKSNQTVVRLEWAQPMGADCPVYIHELPTLFISLENPYHLVDVPRIRTFINGYNSSDVVVKAIVDKLCGRSAFTGKSPVDAFCGKWDARL